MPLSRISLGFAAATALLALTALSPVHADDTPTTPPAASTTAPALKPVLADAAKEKAIRELLQLTGAAQTAKQSIDQELAAVQKNDSSIPDAFWTKFRQKIDINELVSRFIPVYDKYYTKEDIDGMIQFYKSPLGQKMLSTLPNIMKESSQVGEAYGREIATQVVQEMENSDAQKTPTPTTPSKSK